MRRRLRGGRPRLPLPLDRIPCDSGQEFDRLLLPLPLHRAEDPERLPEKLCCLPLRVLDRPVFLHQRDDVTDVFRCLSVPALAHYLQNLLPLAALGYLDHLDKDQRPLFPERLPVPQKEAPHPGVQGVARVDREPLIVLPVKCRLSSPQLGTVLDVVVDEDPILKELDAGGGEEALALLPPECPTGCNAKEWAESLRLSVGLVPYYPVD